MTFSVSEIINYYFNNNNNIKIISSTRGIGFLFHKIISLYLILKKEFNLEYFSRIYNITDNDKYILINLLNKTLTFLNKKNNWKLMFIEENINYNNIYGKPDIILEYKFMNFSNYFFLITQYYYNIRTGILNFNILEDTAYYNYYNKKKIILIDWKCYFNQNIFKSLYNNMNHILKNNILYTTYNKTMIQMNIYKYILETNYDFYVSEMYMYLIDPITFKYQLIPILNLKRDFIVFLIENFITYNHI
jgi:hypothetical protein